MRIVAPKCVEDLPEECDELTRTLVAHTALLFTQADTVSFGAVEYFVSEFEGKADITVTHCTHVRTRFDLLSDEFCKVVREGNQDFDVDFVWRMVNYLAHNSGYCD